ncbi:hypothetical protein Hanom_Chr09g00822901 [Helianthus anomalus]
MFHRFLRLARNGDWYTIEKTHCEAPLLSATVGHTYAWNNQFFFISSRLLPFTVVPRKFSEVLNEKDPKVHELERELLLRIHAYRTKLRAYPEELLVVLGISQDWVDSGFEPFFFVDQKEMSALDYILLNDLSRVEIEQKEIHEGGPSIVHRTEHVSTDGDLESVPIHPIVDSSPAKKQPALTRRSTRGTSSPNAPKASGVAGDIPGQKISDVLKKLNETKRSVPEKVVQVSSEVKTSKIVLRNKVKGGSSKSASPGGEVGEKVGMAVKEKVEVDKGKGHVKAILPIFVPQWQVRTSDTTKSSVVCHDMLKNIATPAEKEALSKLSDEDSAYRVITEAACLVKQLKEDRKWLIGSRIRRFATYLLHSQEFNLHVAGIYSKVMAHGRHTSLIAGVDVASRGEAIEKLSAFKQDSLPDFVDVVKKMEALSYP